MNTLVPGLGPAYGFALLQGAVTLACTASALRQLPLSSARLHWTLAAGCLCLLALNSLVHADYALVLLMREAAQAADWYTQRRPLQVAALCLVGAAIWPIATFVGPTVRRFDQHLQRVAAGLAWLGALLIVRLVSLHHIDRLFDLRLGPLSTGRWLEVAGLGLVFAGIIGALRRPRPNMKTGVRHV